MLAAPPWLDQWQQTSYPAELPGSRISLAESRVSLRHESGSWNAPASAWPFSWPFNTLQYSDQLNTPDAGYARDTQSPFPSKTSPGSNKQSLNHAGQPLGDPVHDFAEFTETMGLGNDWTMFPFSLDTGELPTLDEQHSFSQPFDSASPLHPSPIDQNEELAADTTPASDHFEPTFTIPNQSQDAETDEPSAYDRSVATAPPWNISAECHEHLARSLEPFQDVLPDFVLPSRHALTRYLSGYFDGLHSHLPFIHVPTFRRENSGPELFLAMVAVGAQYRFESQCGLYLFDAAKAVSREQSTRRRWKYHGLGSRPDMTAEEMARRQREIMQTVSALLLLITFATWEDDPEMLEEAIGFQSVIANCLRLQGFSEKTLPCQALDWRSWAQRESDRRVKLISFCYFTLHSVTYNTPSAISIDEIDLRLPCSSAKWNAKTAHEWREAGGLEEPELCFRETLQELLTSTSHGNPAKTKPASPLGNLIMIHALLQRVFTIRQLSAATPAYTAELFEQLERALHRWKISWQRAPESSLDPQNPSGPIPFTSTAILALAHVRLACDLGPHRALATRDPSSIAAALGAIPPISQSASLIPALLHSVQMLSVPVKLGINFVARTHHFFWSVQHCICSLDCAVFLSRWLCQVGSSMEPLGSNEKRLLVWINSVVEEAQVDRCILNNLHNENKTLTPRQLGLKVILAWATIFKGDTSWSIVTMLGESLELVAGMLEKEEIWVSRRA
ncbi:Nicotinate catabolism cluster-specific transcription factor [Paramyrothecium foliicola]|nr:Nicotinate catabolism cluster-specific transcription factor [Paramyrothecium foliicola]